MPKNHSFFCNIPRWLPFLGLFLLFLGQALAQDIQAYRIKMENIQTVLFDFPSVRTASDIQRFPVRMENGETRVMGHRVVLKLKEGIEFSLLAPLLPCDYNLQIHPLQIKGYTLLETRSVRQAAELAAQLSALESVLYAAPEYEIQLSSKSTFAPEPNDKYWPWCWHLDRRDENGRQTGWDMGARSAWAVTLGEGIGIAIMDTGIETLHPDLQERMQHSLHYNVFTQESSPEPNSYSLSHAHGTAIAGLAAASGYNGIGGLGVAPRAILAGWVMLGASRNITDAELAELYLRNPSALRIQNQSWGEDKRMVSLSPIVKDALLVATHQAVDGRGIIMVRASGNDRSKLNGRPDFGDSNNEPLNNWDAVVVGSVDSHGRYASYSSPGANLLVAAPGGSSGDEMPLFMTDFMGNRGYNYANYFPPMEDFNNYATGTMIQGTSFSAPLVSGVCALILAANPELTLRDVRHILVQSAQYLDLEEADTLFNGAGLPVSHNVGYGVPHAGHAVTLAKNWSNLSEASTLQYPADIQSSLNIPEEGYILQILGESLSAPIRLPMTVSDTPFANDSTPPARIVNLGLVEGPVSENLEGRIALIKRGGITFRQKIDYAAEAGAAIAIIYDHEESEELVNMAEVDRCHIPGVFISKSSAETIEQLLADDSNLQAQLVHTPLVYSFEVEESLICEDVSLFVMAQSPDCGTLRVTLVSPSGTRSLLHRYNFGAMQKLDWEFFSTHYFYEPTRGVWQVELSNLPSPTTGIYPTKPLLNDLKLSIRGIPIVDTDNDGLSDEWELARFNSLEYSAQDIISPSGYSNARWQIVGDKTVQEASDLKISVDLLASGKIRLAWPGTEESVYEILERNSEHEEWRKIKTLQGTFPITEYVLSSPSQTGSTFFCVKKP